MLIALWIGLVGATMAPTSDAADTTALRKAAQQGELATVQSLLARGVDADALNEFDVGALYLAATNGHANVCRALIASGATIDARDNVKGYGFTPIGMAAWKGHAEAVLVLMEAGSTDAIGSCFAAASAGHLNVIEAVHASRPFDPAMLTQLWNVANSSGYEKLKSGLVALGATPPPPDEPAAPVALDKAVLKALVGTYAATDDDNERYWVVLRGNVLHVGDDPYALSEMTPLDERVFEVGDEQLRFSVSEEARVTGYAIGDGEDTRERRRISSDLLGFAQRSAPPADTAEKVTRPAPWPSFRGPGGSGVADGQHPPLTWNLENGRHVRWKANVPGMGHSSPVVWGDRVFITTVIGNPEATVTQQDYGWIDAVPENFEHRWLVMCFDRRNGGVLWQKTAHTGVPRNGRHWKASHANPTAAVDAHRVVVSFGSEGLFGYSHDGDLLWKQDLGVLDAGWFIDGSFEWGYSSSPVLHGDRVFVQCDITSDSFVAAYDASSGSELWRTLRDEIPSWCTPLIHADGARTHLVLNASKAVRGYDAMTGRELWRLRGNSNITVSSPIVAEGLFVASGGYDPIKPIYAIRPGAMGDITLAEDADSSDAVAWSYRKGGVYMPTPLAYRGYLYMLASNGRLACYDTRSGERVYRERVAGGQGGGYTASPVAADGHLYFTSEDGDVYVLRAGPEYRIVAHNTLGAGSFATPAISNGTIIFRTHEGLLAFGYPGLRMSGKPECQPGSTRRRALE